VALNLEALRRRHRPDEVRVLFVGESPPASGAFFYACDSNLYRSTVDAFRAAWPDWPADCGPFLARFRAAGCFHDEISHRPVFKLPRAEARRVLDASVGPFARRLRRLRPRAIVAVKKAIRPWLETALARAGGPAVPVHLVPYPVRGHQVAYVREVAALLADLERRGVLGQ
jgi:hypothetical protein